MTSLISYIDKTIGNAQNIRVTSSFAFFSIFSFLFAIVELPQSSFYDLIEIESPLVISQSYAGVSHPGYPETRSSNRLNLQTFLSPQFFVQAPFTAIALTFEVSSATFLNGQGRGFGIRAPPQT